MKLLSVNTGWLLQRWVVSADDKAEAAYASLKAAMTAYDRFSNDKEASISVDLDDGKATFKLEALHGVTLEDLNEKQDDYFVEAAIRDARLKDKVAAATVKYRTHQPVEQAAVPEKQI